MMTCPFCNIPFPGPFSWQNRRKHIRHDHESHLLRCADTDYTDFCFQTSDGRRLVLGDESQSLADNNQVPTSTPHHGPLSTTPSRRDHTLCFQTNSIQTALLSKLLNNEGQMVRFIRSVRGLVEQHSLSCNATLQTEYDALESAFFKTRQAEFLNLRSDVRTAVRMAISSTRTQL